MCLMMLSFVPVPVRSKKKQRENKIHRMHGARVFPAVPDLPPPTHEGDADLPFTFILHTLFPLVVDFRRKLKNC